MNARFPFDRGLDGAAKAIRWAYPARILLVRNAIGPDADDDTEIIPYSKKHGLILVTKDWKTATVDLQVTKLRAAGVSAWWIREEERKQMKRPALLYALSRDIDRVAFAVETASRAVHTVSSVGRAARTIEIPFAKRRGSGLVLPARPKPKIARPIPFGQKLFE